MKKRVLSTLLSLTFAVSLMPAMGITAGADTNYEYYDKDGVKQTVAATSITSGMDQLNSGWYVVNSNVELSYGFYSYDDVSIILMDGCKLTLGGAMYIDGNLTIYGQSAGTGAIEVQSDGIVVEEGCSLTVNGGNITSDFNDSTYANVYNDGGTITINGGTLTANPTEGEDDSCSVTNKGTMIVNGGKLNVINNDITGYAICNESDYNTCANFTINGGAVTISGNSLNVIVNNKCGSNEATFTINGGYLLATSDNEDSSAIANYSTMNFFGGVATFKCGSGVFYSNRDIVVKKDAIITTGSDNPYMNKIPTAGDGKLSVTDNDKYLSVVYHNPDDCITFSSAQPFSLTASTDAETGAGTIFYSTDKEEWEVWDYSEITAEGSDETGYSIYMYGDTYNTVITAGNVWTLDGTEISCTGNIETLRGATGNNPSPVKMGDDCYSCMFYDNEGLIKAPTLPATELSIRCYSCMFDGCSSLKEAPVLPATVLSEYCYYNMFYGCTSLTKVPDLNATRLADYCCYAMCQGCTSLTKLPALPATTLAISCYESMFWGCKGIKLREADMSLGSWSGIPENAYGGGNQFNNMFKYTGGTFTGNPVRGKTYYYEILPTFADTTYDSGYYASSKGASDKSGVVAFTSIFDNLTDEFKDFQFGTNDKFGISMFRTTKSVGGLDKTQFDFSISATDFDSLEDTENYFYSIVKNIPANEFGTVIYALPFAIIGGVTYWGGMVNTTVNGTSGTPKYLGASE